MVLMLDEEPPPLEPEDEFEEPEDEVEEDW